MAKLAKKVKRNAAKLGRVMKHTGKAVAHEFKTQVRKEFKDVLGKDIFSKQEAKKMLAVVLSELHAEKERFADFAKAELKRELRKAKPHVKKVVKGLRKR